MLRYANISLIPDKLFKQSSDSMLVVVLGFMLWLTKIFSSKDFCGFTHEVFILGLAAS